MSVATIGVVIGLLALGWATQLFLTNRQARVFMREVTSLRQRGRTAIGVAKISRFGRKVYVAVAAGADGQVVAARKLQGFTVLARPRPVPELTGRSLEELATEEQDSPTERAAAMAARTISGSADDHPEPAPGTTASHVPSHT